MVLQGVQTTKDSPKVYKYTVMTKLLFLRKSVLFIFTGHSRGSLLLGLIRGPSFSSESTNKPDEDVNYISQFKMILFLNFLKKIL